MEYANLLWEINQQVATVTVNRPKALNALNQDVLRELADLLLALEQDDSCRIIILTGAGRAFVAGADIAQMRELNVEQGRAMNLMGQRVTGIIDQLQKPVIAAVNGFALGGGCELAMACDMCIAADSAKFGQPEVNLGIIPGFGGTQRLPRLTNKSTAKYLIMTGQMIDAQEALRLGIAQKVVPAENLLAEADALARLILSKSPVAVGMAKLAVNNGVNMELRNGVAYENEAYTTCFASADRVEGMSAFLEKRPAEFNWQGAPLK